MRYPKYILFDLGGTILGEMTQNIEKGFEALEEIAEHKGKSEKMSVFNKILGERYKTAHQNGFEYNFFSFYRLFSDITGLVINRDIGELEEIFFENAYSYAGLEKGVLEVFRYLKEKGIKFGIFSNSPFLSTTLGNELERQGVDTNWFEFIISSAEYGMIKPEKIVFEALVEKCKCSNEEVWYIGDTFEADVKGAQDAGIKPVWYNKSGTNYDGVLSIKNWNEIINVLEEIK